MSVKAIVIALALSALGRTLALSQTPNPQNPQTANSANVHAVNLDRCPYYPSPVFYRDASRPHEQDEMDHDADGRQSWLPSDNQEAAADRPACFSGCSPT